MGNDIGEALDEGSVPALIMLDLSAAFHVIDNLILLKHLQFSFDIKENALNGVKSYLSDRTKRVSVTDKTSLDLCFYCGVPHGSVLGQ